MVYYPIEKTGHFFQKGVTSKSKTNRKGREVSNAACS
jgi:hypothetical protein